MKIAIDAGHGMGNRTPTVFDSGATGGGFREADMALGYAIALRSALTALGIASFLVRENNQVGAPLSRRAPLAEQHGCTAFVSLHLNAPGPGAAGANGLEVYYRAPKDETL